MRRLAVTLLLAPATALAHPLDLSTTRVTLRDAHVELTAEWDLFLLAHSTPTELATAPDARLQGLHAALRSRVERETRLLVDGTSLELQATGFPTEAELRAMAAELSATARDHGLLARLRLESSAIVSDARRISAASPASLGPVVTSFVQPSQALADPGQTVSFEVLAPRSESRTSAWIGLAGLLGLTTLGAILVALRRSRRST